MDAVMFHLKAAHLGVQRVGRELLGGFRQVGMTPARFDLMNALGTKGMRQSDLWKHLNVVRSVISRMVRSLGELGWVKRVRAADGRTWLVMPTRRGREVFERAYDDCVESGDATVKMHAGLARRHFELDSQQMRLDFIYACDALESTFRTVPWFHGDDLYGWHPEDYWTWITTPDDPTGTEMIPWVSDWRAAEA